MSTIPQIQWMCTKCGRKHTKSSNAGRPEPGKCPNGGVHNWIKNK